MSTDSFPLFRLPLVALKHVFAEMQPINLLDVSLCSKRSQSVVKSLHRRKTKIHLYLCDNPEVKLLPEGNNEEALLVFGKTESEAREEFLREKVRLEQDELISKFNAWAEYFCDLFNYCATRVELENTVRVRTRQRRPVPGALQSVIGWLLTVQYPVHSLRLSSDETLPNDLLKSLLDCLIDRNTRSFELNVTTNTNFRYNQLLDLDRLHLLSANWFTLCDLSMMDCVHVRLDQCLWTSSEMNLFLKMFMKGSFPRLELFQVTLCELSDQEVMEGIQNQKQDESFIRPFKSFNGVTKVMRGGYDIEREDGLVGTVGYPPRIRRAIDMVVWHGANHPSNFTEQDYVVEEPAENHQFIQYEIRMDGQVVVDPNGPDEEDMERMGFPF